MNAIKTYEDLQIKVKSLEEEERFTFERGFNDGGFNDSDFVPSRELQTLQKCLTEHEAYIGAV